jgi:hypothetical protein
MVRGIAFGKARLGNGFERFNVSWSGGLCNGIVNELPQRVTALRCPAL